MVCKRFFHLGLLTSACYGRTMKLVFLVLILFGCQKQLTPIEAHSTESHIIVGDLDWREAENLKLPKTVHRQLNYVLPIQSDRKRCNGLLVAPRLILTAAHCLGEKMIVKEEVDCPRILYQNKKKDYGFIHCPNLENNDFYDLFDFQEVSIEEKVYLLQHNCSVFDSNCKIKLHISKGKILKDSPKLKHSADTFPGASGSPLFSAKSYRLIGIHLSGNEDSPFYGKSNNALPIFEIIEDLRLNCPELLDFSSIPKALQQ